jgi:hypothetical protein
MDYYFPDRIEVASGDEGEFIGDERDGKSGKRHWHE